MTFGVKWLIPPEVFVSSDNGGIKGVNPQPRSLASYPRMEYAVIIVLWPRCFARLYPALLATLFSKLHDVTLEGSEVASPVVLANQDIRDGPDIIFLCWRSSYRWPNIKTLLMRITWITVVVVLDLCAFVRVCVCVCVCLWSQAIDGAVRGGCS